MILFYNIVIETIDYDKIHVKIIILFMKKTFIIFIFKIEK